MTASDREVELKFACGPRDLALVLAAAPPGDDDTAELISVYFDTPDLALQKAGASLRVRERAGRRVQTLKRGEGMSREEHEAPIDGLAPDPQFGPLSKLMPAGSSLRPAFNVRVSRLQRSFRYQGAAIELALDQGEVAGGAVTAPICEVELELKAGPPAALFALARKLLEITPLYLSFDSKAARGQALMAGSSGDPRGSAAVDLDGDETVAEAFQATARQALAQIAANAAVIRARPSPEAVHQLRVGARRFRSALTTFKEALGGDGLEAVKAELAWLARACDAARNLDVFADSLVGEDPGSLDRSPGAAALRKSVATARRRARSGVAETVSSARFRRQMVDAAAWVEIGDWIRGAKAQAPVRAFAERALARRRRAVLKKGRGIREADDAALHQLRIAAKKLRYASDALASLYRKRRVRAFEAHVKRLQTELGELNDLATAGPLVQRLSLSPVAAFAAGQLLGRRLADKPRRIAHAARTFARLADAEPFWA